MSCGRVEDLEGKSQKIGNPVGKGRTDKKVISGEDIASSRREQKILIGNRLIKSQKRFHRSAIEHS